MDDVRLLEKIKYERMWADCDYRQVSPAERDLSRFLDVAKIDPSKEPPMILDLGCGTGRAGLKLYEMGFNVHMIDITETSLDKEVCEVLEKLEKEPNDLRAFWFDEACAWSLDDDLIKSGLLLFDYDWGFCYDVMEHIPEEKVDAVFASVSALCREAFFQICTIPDGFGQRIGETLHLTVKPSEWWLEKIKKHYVTVSFQEDGSHVYIYGK